MMFNKQNKSLYLSLIWKILFFLMLFQAIVLIGYAYLAKAELDQRLIKEKTNFKAMSEVYLQKALDNHVQHIVEQVYRLAEAEKNTKSNMVNYIRHNWPNLAIDWGATGVGIFDQEQKIRFEYGKLNLTTVNEYVANSYDTNLPSYYIVCQKDCYLNIITPLMLDKKEQFLLVSTNLFNPIIQFQELLNLKSAILTSQQLTESTHVLNTSEQGWLGNDFKMLRKNTNKYYYELLKQASRQANLDVISTTGVIVDLEDAHFFISAFQLPFEHHKNSYFLVFNDISHNLQLDQDFNRTYLWFSIGALLLMAFLVVIILFPPIARIKKLRAYLPTLAKGEKIDLLPLEQRQIFLKDEIDILEDSSNELALHLSYLNNAVKDRESELKEIALFDNLTGLPNRGNFTSELDRSIKKIEIGEKFIAVIFIDLDRFKHINDTLGHDVGDQVLKTVAKRLKNSIRSSDIVARLGGDEFTILLRNLTSNQNIVKIINVILESFEDPAKIKNRMINIQLSMGITTIKQNDISLTDVIKQADIAMYNAKNSKVIRYSFFKEEMESQITNQFNLLNDFNPAIATNEFQLFFQPFYNLKDDSLFGFECLIRWQHVEKGLLTPDKFLPILHDTEYMPVLEHYILEQGIKSCGEMNQNSGSPLVFSINLTADMFMSKNLVNTIERLLRTYAVDPALIYIEIVEDSLISDLTEGICRIKKIQSLGIKVSLDDFGVGYSSLNYLRQLPVDNIKIDRSFVEEIILHKQSKQLLASLIDLLINIEKSVTAEGIENVEQLEWLKKHGCHIGQGYYFNKPLPADKALDLVCSISGDNVEYINFTQ